MLSLNQSELSNEINWKPTINQLYNVDSVLHLVCTVKSTFRSYKLQYKDHLAIIKWVKLINLQMKYFLQYGVLYTFANKLD